MIIGYNDLIADGLLGNLNPEPKECIERIDKNAHQLLDLINATLDLSRLEAGKVRLDLVDLLPLDLVAEIDAETRDLREDKSQVAFVVDAEPDLPVLRTDRLKLKVVLKNLINNAIKFTHTGTIRFAARRREGGVEFEVSDTGIGIGRDMQGIIFEPSRQADGSISRAYGGVGLGLYIVRRLTDLLGGRVTLQSAPGEGSTFRVWIPSQPLEAQAVQTIH